MAGWPAHVIDTGGDLPPLVLVHGILVSSRSFRHNIEPLSRAFRVIAPCQKGHGHSGRGPDPYDLASLSRFVVGVLDHLGIDRAHFAGNSLGGAVSARIALDHPSRVDRLVLINPAARPFAAPVEAFLRLQGPVLTPLYRAVGQEATYRTFLRSLVYGNLSTIDTAYMAEFMAHVRTPGTVAAAATIAGQLPRELDALWPRLRGLSQATLLVWGQKDRIVPLRHGVALAQQLPNARLEILPHVGHAPHEEHPARFNALVTDFLSRQIPRARHPGG